jgi:hypothetical protein
MNMRKAPFWARQAAACTGAAMLAAGGSATAAANDYPTEARVDYVLGCMASNGQNRLVMQRCACSIDAIAKAIPYEDYVRVETILSLREGRGELAVMFRSSPALDERVQTFKQAQIEADLQCF